MINKSIRASSRTFALHFIFNRMKAQRSYRLIATIGLCVLFFSYHTGKPCASVVLGSGNYFRCVAGVIRYHRPESYSVTRTLKPSSNRIDWRVGGAARVRFVERTRRRKQESRLFRTGNWVLLIWTAHDDTMPCNYYRYCSPNGELVERLLCARASMLSSAFLLCFLNRKE